jgi:hypothetical protein
VQAWFLAHFPDLYSVDESPKYFSNYLIASKWEIERGHGEGKTYYMLLDSMENDDICWMSYEEHMEIQKFLEIFWYSGWIMCGVEKVCRHLPERVKRQYGYVQDIPRYLTYVLSMRASHTPQAFIDFRPHTTKEESWGQPTKDIPWWFEDGNMLWYGRVSLPHIFPPIMGSPSRPANEEQIIADQHQHQERGSPDTYDMVSGVVFQADDYLGQEGMTSDQLYAALRHVREQLAPVLTRRCGGSNKSKTKTYF